MLRVNLTGDQLTEHFKLREFICSDGETAIITPDFLLFVNCLEQLRRWYNRPINITSGFRTAAHNKSVGGSKNSLHLIGQAIDFRFCAEYKKAAPARKLEYEEHLKEKWWDICYAAGVFPHMGIYKTHFHIGISRETEFFKDWRL